VHSLWDQLQSFSRLQSPTEEGQLHIQGVDQDELRRDTLGVIERLKTLREDFQRLCQQAAHSLIDALHPQLGKTLRAPIEQAVSLVTTMRQSLGHLTKTDEIAKECRLADEFLSHQLLENFSAAQRAIDEHLLGEHSRVIELETSWVGTLKEFLVEMLATEVAYRRLHDFYYPKPDAPVELAKFIERGSQLKKHFQDVLFLDNEAHMVDLRLRNWTGIFAASLAASFWLGFTLLPLQPGARFGLASVMFMLSGIIAYALKDRVKEVVRGWLAGRLVRLYGQRMLRLRQPSRVDPRRLVLVEARETLGCPVQVREDSLNRTIGRTRRVVVITYHMRAEICAAPKLLRAGIDSIRHIFRYDLSPIFGRLDEPLKRILLLDEATGEVRYADAPKEYRFPIRVSARIDGKIAQVVAAELILSKGGIDRLEDVQTSGFTLEPPTS
jgi:hypothetical protein